MPPTFTTKSGEKNILVLQTRTNRTEAHERLCFGDFAANNQSIRFVYRNTLRDSLTADTLRGIHGVIIGGSGEFYLSHRPEWLPKLNGLIDETRRLGLPLLGICFGFQVIALHLGAELIADPARAESGTYDMTVRPEAALDPLYLGLPGTFVVPLGHQETIVNLPPNLENLSHTALVDCQSFRLPPEPVWGVLYHPEMKKQRMLERYALSPEYLRAGITDMSDHLSDTPEANAVLRRWLDVVRERA